MKVEIDEEAKRAKVFVNEDQQSIAIGRGGQNVRLASRALATSLISNRQPHHTAPKPATTKEEHEDSAS